jgi:hypothetical protein
MPHENIDDHALIERGDGWRRLVIRQPGTALKVSLYHPDDPEIRVEQSYVSISDPASPLEGRWFARHPGGDVAGISPEALWWLVRFVGEDVPEVSDMTTEEGLQFLANKEWPEAGNDDGRLADEMAEVVLTGEMMRFTAGRPQRPN